MAEMEYEFHHTVAPPTLGTILSIYPIRRGILDCLGTRNILAFMQTSRAIRQDLRENEWNINKKLERFFKNPIAFRTQLGQADALITGDFVLGFFERIVWPDVGLDLVIRHNDNLAGMQKFLVSENYTKAESVPINDTTCKNLTAIETWSISGESTDGDGPNQPSMPVKLFVTKFAPVQIALSRSATSAGVNFITWNKAYSIFPQATFLAYETVPLQPLNQALRGSLIKCSIRGWRMRTESLILAESEDSEQPLGNLRFKARSTGRGWGYEDHAAQLFHVSYNIQDPEAILGGLNNRDQIGTWSMARDCIPLATGSYDLKSPCLRYEYTTGSPARGIRPKLDDLLQRNLIGQLLKFSSKDRGKLVGKRTPEDLRRDISDVDFDPPEGWDYLDETIPELYKAWESKGRVDEEDYY